jgi:hypothetical protein
MSDLLTALRASEDFNRTMRKVEEALARIDWPRLRLMLDAIEGYDEHHPRPLPIDGHAYARRRRNR